MDVGKMSWPELIAKAMAESAFKALATVQPGVKDDHELRALLDILKATSVGAEPRTANAELKTKAAKVRELLARSQLSLRVQATRGRSARR